MVITAQSACIIIKLLSPSLSIMQVDVDLGLGPFPIILLHDIPLNTSYIYCQPIVSTTPTITSAIGTLSTSTTKETNTGAGDLCNDN